MGYQYLALSVRSVAAVNDTTIVTQTNVQTNSKTATAAKLEDFWKFSLWVWFGGVSLSLNSRPFTGKITLMNIQGEGLFLTFCHPLDNTLSLFPPSLGQKPSWTFG